MTVCQSMYSVNSTKPVLNTIYQILFVKYLLSLKEQVYDCEITKMYDVEEKNWYTLFRKNPKLAQQ